MFACFLAPSSSPWIAIAVYFVPAPCGSSRITAVRSSMPAAFYGTPAAFCGRRLLAAGCAEVIRRQARPLPEAQSQSTAQVGQIERGLAIAAKGSPEEREERRLWRGIRCPAKGTRAPT